MNYIEISHLRLERAREHLLEFIRGADTFLKTKPYQLVTQRQFEGTQEFLIYCVKISNEPPYRLGIIIGDLINNLRSACDNLVWGLGQALNVSDASGFFFPICQNRRQYEGLLANELKGFRDLPVAAQTLIEQLQPYNQTQDPTGHLLYVLNRLWNDDKHRTPVLCFSTHKGIHMTRVNITGPVSIRAQGIIKDGAELLRIPVFPGDPPLYEKVGFTFDIALAGC
jgi:hypothetical protein